MEPKKDKPKEPVKEPEKPKPDYAAILEKQNKATEKQEAANKKTEELIKRQEELAIENRLGGKADAGEGEPKKKEETPEEYAQRLFEGKANPLEDDKII